MSFPRECSLDVPVNTAGGDATERHNIIIEFALDEAFTRVLARKDGGPDVLKPVIVPAHSMYFRVRVPKGAQGKYVVAFTVCALDGVWIQVRCHAQ